MFPNTALFCSNIVSIFYVYKLQNTLDQYDFTQSGRKRKQEKFKMFCPGRSWLENEGD